MISFEILGEVTARQDAWVADLSRQQQQLLAVLVITKGAPVGRERLEEVLWDFRTPYPEGGVKRVAHELRSELRRASPGGDPVPACNGGYRLSITPEQADVLRFRASFAEARHTSGPAGLELMRQALREWGPDAAGLHGGHPLRGLGGQWADGIRHKLRTEHRDAVVHYLAQGMSHHDYGLVLGECEQRADDGLDALLDEEFIEVWMRASSHAGHPARAHQIYQRAADAAARAGVRLDASLHRLDAHLTADGSQPGVSLAVAPQKPIPVTSDRRPVREQETSEDAGGQPATGQPATGQQATVRGTIHADKVSGYAAAVRTDLATGRIEGDTWVGSVEAGGELIGVDHRQRG